MQCWKSNFFHFKHSLYGSFTDILALAEPFEGKQSDEKKLRFAECYREKEPEDIVDAGFLPGNHLGAGGIDSILFSWVIFLSRPRLVW